MIALLNSHRARRRPLRHRGERQPCNLCGGEDVVVVRRRDRYLNRLINVMCRNCGLVFLDPLPTQEDIDAYYRYDFWEATKGALEPSPRQLVRDERISRARLSLLKKAGVLEHGRRILDLGAGSGAFLNLAQRDGFDIEGIEPNVAFARYAERTYGAKVQAVTLNEAEFGDRKFDLISTNHVLEHMLDPLATLRRCHELLRPGGHLHVWVPDLDEPGRSPLRFLHSGHLYGFTYETLVMMAARAGFAPVTGTEHGTWIVFDRLPGPDPNWFKFPGHAAANEAAFRHRTMWRYLTRANTILQVPKRIRRWVRDYFTIKAQQRSSDAQR